MCCILILIPLELQWVMGGRNLPNVLINPSPGLSQHLKYPD